MGTHSDIQHVDRYRVVPVGKWGMDAIMDPSNSAWQTIGHWLMQCNAVLAQRGTSMRIPQCIVALMDEH
jgi:hypothetical protein